MKQAHPLFIPVLLAASFLTGALFANDACVRFDAPATVPACDVTDEAVVDANQKLIQLVIPVSTLVECRNDQRVLEMLIQIRGLGTGIQVADYGPRTQMYSDIDGPVSVEQRSDFNRSLGLGASGTAAEIVKLDAKANLGRTTGKTERFQRLPEQKLLLASGTVSRGNGVWYKFRHSPQTTLEGGHELVMTLRVPASWRGGMLRVDCQATGKERYLLGEADFQAGNASFVVATYLKGDAQAQETVERYSLLESRIRNAAQLASDTTSNTDLLGQLFRKPDAELPADWPSRFALFDSQSIEQRIKPYLSGDLQRATDRFLASRRDVLALAR